MIALYGPAWTRAQRVMWMLEELGVEYEHRTVPPPSDLAPSGKVPVLVDGATSVRESLAINVYLAAPRVRVPSGGSVIFVRKARDPLGQTLAGGRGLTGASWTVRGTRGLRGS